MRRVFSHPAAEFGPNVENSRLMRGKELRGMVRRARLERHRVRSGRHRGGHAPGSQPAAEPLFPGAWPLHQLRGPVGRGADPATAILVVGGKPTELALRRLKVLEETTDGFWIAEEDLAIRGPGDFLGTRQSGIPPFRVADIIRDAEFLRLARNEASDFAASPEFETAEYGESSNTSANPGRALGAPGRRGRGGGRRSARSAYRSGTAGLQTGIAAGSGRNALCGVVFPSRVCRRSNASLCVSPTNTVRYARSSTIRNS